MTDLLSTLGQVALAVIGVPIHVTKFAVYWKVLLSVLSLCLLRSVLVPDGMSSENIVPIYT